jgi:hypothetical protein
MNPSASDLREAAILRGEERMREGAEAKAAAQAKANARDPNFVRPSGHTNASYWKWLAVNRDMLAQRRAEREREAETARAQVQATEAKHDFTAAREEANGLTAHIVHNDEIE